MRISVASLNVHAFRSKTGKSNTHQLSHLIEKHSFDVLCLQEAYGGQSSLIGQQTGYACTGGSKGGIVLLTKHNIIKQECFSLIKGRALLYCCVEPIQGTKIDLFVTHLDHRDEAIRLRQMSQIQTFICQTIQNRPHFLIGDLNALHQADYSAAYWESIRSVRLNNDWELPRSYLMNSLLENEENPYEAISSWLHYSDALSFASTEVTLATCRFDTRIDYILFHKSTSPHSLLDYQVVNAPFTDHSLVLVTLDVVNSLSV